MKQTMRFNVGDILVCKSLKYDGEQSIVTITGYEYKPHLKCFAYDLEHVYTNKSGRISISKYETESLSIKIMVERDGFIHYPVVQ